MRRRLSLVVLFACLPSCASGTYLGERARDLRDCFTLTGSIGPELSADVQLTELAHVMVGGGGHLEAGWIDGQWGHAPMVMLGLPVAPFMEEGVLYGRYVFTESGGAWDLAEVQDECYLVHALPVGVTNPQRPWVERFDLEVGVTVLIGARVGFSPGQLVDFVGGWFGWDPAGDDQSLMGEPAGTATIEGSSAPTASADMP